MWLLVSQKIGGWDGLIVHEWLVFVLIGKIVYFMYNCCKNGFNSGWKSKNVILFI